MENIGTRMRKIRESTGKIQYAVAIEAGISQSAYARIESGQRVPRLQTLQAIAKSLDVPISSLLPTTGNWLMRTSLLGILIGRIRYGWRRWRCNVAAGRA